MTLTRVWTPTSYYSGGNQQDLLIIHTMEGFTGPNGAYDCATYFQGNVGASSHVCIDNNRGTIWEGVARTNAAWTVCGFNYKCLSVEQSGYASWSQSYWLANRDAQLHNVADWLAEESAKTGIPLRLLSASEAQGGGRGVSFHSRLGSTGCGHSDPGDGFPIQQVLEWAKGGTAPTPTPEPEGAFMPASAYFGGVLHMVMINDKGQVCYDVEGGQWPPVDPSQSGAKGGAGIAISDEGAICLTYINGSNKVCTYVRAAAKPGQPVPAFIWGDRGGKAKG